MDIAELGQGDVVTAVQSWLADGGALAEAAEGRFFGHGLPDDEAQSMPRACVVITDAGGYTDDLPEAMDRGRVDIRAYGETRDVAKRVAVLVRARMRELTRTVRHGVVLSAASRVGGYIPYSEPIGGWPAVLRSYLVPYVEEAD